MKSNNEDHNLTAPLRQRIANQRKELQRLNKMLNLIRLGANSKNKMDAVQTPIQSVWDNKKAMASFIRPREM